ncbi:sensor histidine kinase [Cellulomonas fengjieae]|uniref:histidine kinase n=1 Tax=Cellulomonas fengjieae TaxID=2819978 RepID=A0ABS3SI04_9CELL|nr:histidine kinase [Cellulomonas fengjieae]MBO3085373.1 two-component sensor histidine kinase [Cellulomonas fengjieae]MBO3101118.1 two-component sensor histidine kinase [Cellulomonas fengjieae]QVI66075.1 two-component sensor histidine kinase [Cellulomonas fengjieae]
MLLTTDLSAETPLSRWSSTWRYLLAAVVGLLAWAISTGENMSVSTAPEEVLGGLITLDLLLGVMTVCLLGLRRRYPVAVACLTIAATSVSAASIGAATIAVISMATWRRRAWVVIAGVVTLGALGLSMVYNRTAFPGMPDDGYVTVVTLLISVMHYVACVATGYYIGTRRELVSSLREQVATAERERELATERSRDAERTRIAREMHDVLAHRISLVALHAGALAYRDDLTRTETRETAQTIQGNAQLALSELRQVLGVLRAGADTESVEGVEPPQPTLAELPALLADAREAGSAVDLDTTGLADEPRPATLSRTSFRIVQEALTNARKHAPGEPVSVRLAGGPGATLEIQVRNPVRTPPNGHRGVGLAGMTERAELAGGELEHGVDPDGNFVVGARLPWPA